MRGLLGLTLALTACAAPTWQNVPHDRLFQRTPPPKLHGAPAKTHSLDGWYAMNQAAWRPLSVAVNPGHYVEKLVGGPPALDVNHFGQVIDSTWFTNRIGRMNLTPEAARIGPNLSGEPAPGPFLVIGGKVEGATPGLVIRDTAGVEFIVKFDPPAFPGLSSGAEVISTKVLWAAGYNVPQNYVVTFELSRLSLDPSATTAGKLGETVALTQKRLDDLIALVNPYPDGTIRALFSRRIDGRPLGPFSYRGQRRDDPNDLVPHERRRSLRGLWLFSAWLNNTDTRRANTMDVFVPGPAGGPNGHVRHYLLDFGDALGSAGTKPKFPGQGYQYRMDWALIAQSLFSLGLVYRYWIPVLRSPFRAVGLYEAQIFDPSRWRPNLPNPAFDEATRLDTYWAGSIIAQFRPEHLVAIVDAAGYTEAGAKEWVLRVLLARQYKVLAYAFEGFLPLDYPRAQGWHVELVDLAVQSNLLLQPDAVRYRWRAEDMDGRVLGEGISAEPRADLKAAAAALAAGAPPFMSIRWWRLDNPDPSVVVHARVLPDQLLVIGLDRKR